MGEARSASPIPTATTHITALPDELIAEIARFSQPSTILALARTNKSFFETIINDSTIWENFHRIRFKKSPPRNKTYSYKEFRRRLIERKLQKFFGNPQPPVSFEQSTAETIVELLCMELGRLLLEKTKGLCSGENYDLIHRDDHPYVVAAIKSILFVGAHPSIAITTIETTGGTHYRLRSTEEMKLPLTQLLVEEYLLFDSVTTEETFPHRRLKYKSTLIPHAPNLSYAVRFKRGEIAQETKPLFTGSRHYDHMPWENFSVETLETHQVYPDFTLDQFRYFYKKRTSNTYFDHYFQTPKINNALLLALHAGKFVLASQMLEQPIKFWIKTVTKWEHHDRYSTSYLCTTITVVWRDAQGELVLQEFDLAADDAKKALEKADMHLHIAINSQRNTLEDITFGAASNELLIKLITAGASLEAKNENDQRPFYVLAKKEDWARISAIAISSKPNSPAISFLGNVLISCVEKGKFDIATLLIKKGCSLTWHYPDTKNYLFHVAMKKENVPPAFIQLLVEYGLSELDTKNSSGFTPIAWAAAYKAWDNIKAVLAVHPNANPNDTWAYWQALSIAIRAKRWDIAALLLRTRLYVDAFNENNGNGLLHTSVINEAPLAIIQALLCQKINLSRTNKEGHLAEKYAAGATLQLIKGRPLENPEAEIQNAIDKKEFEIVSLLLINNPLSDDIKNKIFNQLTSKHAPLDCMAHCITPSSDLSRLSDHMILPLLKCELLRVSTLSSKTEVALAIKKICDYALQRFTFPKFTTPYINTLFFRSWSTEKAKVVGIINAAKEALLTLIAERNFQYGSTYDLDVAKFSNKIFSILETANASKIPDAKELENELRNAVKNYASKISGFTGEFTTRLLNKSLKLERPQEATEADDNVVRAGM